MHMLFDQNPFFFKNPVLMGKWVSICTVKSYNFGMTFVLTICVVYRKNREAYFLNNIVHNASVNAMFLVIHLNPTRNDFKDKKIIFSTTKSKFRLLFHGKHLVSQNLRCLQRTFNLPVT